MNRKLFLLYILFNKKALAKSISALTSLDAQKTLAVVIKETNAISKG